MDKFIRKWRDESQKSKVQNNIPQKENVLDGADSQPLCVRNKKTPQKENSSNDADLSESQCIRALSISNNNKTFRYFFFQ